MQQPRCHPSPLVGPALRHLRPEALYRMLRLPSWEGKLSWQ
jgi:hypothetical protein